MSIADSQVQDAGWYDDPAGQARWRYWDGRHWTHRTSNAKDPATTKPPLASGFASLADWLSRLLALQSVLLAGASLAIVWAWTTIGAYGLPLATLFDPAAPSRPDVEEDLARFGIALTVTLGTWLVVYVVGGIVWLVWQARLAGSAPREVRRSAGLQVVAWFIPILNLWWPYQDVKDLWASYRPHTSDTEMSPVGLWWGLYLGLPLLWGFSVPFVMATSTPDDVVDRLAVSYAIFFLVYAGLALVARGVVRKLSWRALEFWAVNQDVAEAPEVRVVD